MKTLNAILNCISNFIFNAYEYLSVRSFLMRSKKNANLGLVVGLVNVLGIVVLSLVLGLISVLNVIIISVIASVVLSVIIISMIITLIISTENCIQIKTMTGPVSRATFSQRVEAGVNP